MRAQSALDKRAGNNYRYHRAVLHGRELEEKKAQEDKWTKIYRKAEPQGEKAGGFGRR